MADETKETKAARAGWVGQKLDHLESVLDQLPQEDRFLVKRMLRVHADEGGVGDRQLLHHLRVVSEKHKTLSPKA